MCFSAEASFTGAALLVGMSYACSTQMVSKKQIPMLCIPILLAVTQFIEGLAWLSFTHDAFPRFFISFANHYFLFISYFVWPILFSVAFLLLEKKASRRLILKALLLLNILWAGGILCLLLTHPIVEPKIVHRSIQYYFFLLDNDEWHSYIQFITASLPVFSVFTSTLPGKGLLGIFGTFLLCLAAFVYAYAGVSVWCFFATVISIFIFRILHLMKKQS